MAAPGDWSAFTLCTDTDLARFETNVQEWVKSQGGAAPWRATAKERIESKLRSQLRDQELTTDTADVLDLLGNPEVLRDAACFMTLHLIATDKMIHISDLWAAKAAKYKDDFDEEFPEAVSRLSFDSDESGDITDEERYNLTMGVRITRGG